jgi:hypothetical protein
LFATSLLRHPRFRLFYLGSLAMHMVNMGQLAYPKCQVTAAANQFYSLAF